MPPLLLDSISAPYAATMLLRLLSSYESHAVQPSTTGMPMSPQTAAQPHKMRVKRRYEATPLMRVFYAPLAPCLRCCWRHVYRHAAHIAVCFVLQHAKSSRSAAVQRERERML